MAKSLIDPDLNEAYGTWSLDRSPEANAVILKTLDPVIDKAVRTHTGTHNPLLKSKARKMTLKALGSYDPQRGRLQSHLYAQLQGLKRTHAQQSHIMQAPERIRLEKRGLSMAKQELEDELGREPTDSELAIRTGLSVKRISKIRTYRPAASEGFLASIGDAGGLAPAVKSPEEERNTAWARLVYDDLGPMDRKIMEWSLGLNGQPTLSNQEIAVRLKRSPGAVSQRKMIIQKMLHQEQELSPFG
jgi:DNA-directed RNA polymerase specialized sigma subunit